jgi:hypothetical protein
MIYTLPFDDIACGATQNLYQTIAALKVDNTSGHRIRIRGLYVGPADDTPDDKDVGLQLARVDLSASGATAGVAASSITAANMPKPDLGAKTAPAIGYVDFISPTGAAEPETYEADPIFQRGFNIRQGLVREWGLEDEDLIVVPQNYLIGLLIAPRVATAFSFSGELTFEWF